MDLKSSTFVSRLDDALCTLYPLECLAHRVRPGLGGNFLPLHARPHAQRLSPGPGGRGPLVNPYLNRYIGGRLREVRLFRGLSQKTLAERAGISQTQLSKIERNVSAPRYSTIYRLADALGVTPEWLLGLEDYDFRPSGPRPL